MPQDELLIKPVDPAEITESQITETNEGIRQYEDSAALSLLIEDADQADASTVVQAFTGMWNEADILLQSPAFISPYAQGSVRTRYPDFTLSTHISVVVPKIKESIFYLDPPFDLRPYPGTSEDVVRAKKVVFSNQLFDMKFEEECERGLEQMSLLGTCIYKWGWCSHTEKIKTYKRKGDPISVSTLDGSTKKYDTLESDDFEVVFEDREIQRPWIKQLDVRHVLVDPGTRVGDIRTAGYVIHRDYVTYDQLDALREIPGYDIPSRETLKSLFFPPEKQAAGPGNAAEQIVSGYRAWLQHAVARNEDTSKDPYVHKIELLERWDKDKVIVALRFGNGSVLIRNDANPYGKIPFYSANWRNLPDSFYGQGLGMLIGTSQRVKQGAREAALRILDYSTKPIYIRKKGLNTPTQNIRMSLGGIYDVDDDVDKAFKLAELPKVPTEVWETIRMSDNDAATASGANEQVMQGAASAGVNSTGMRSGTGAQLVGQANASRLDGPSARFVNQIFVPWLYQMDELNNEYLPGRLLRQLLSKELGDTFELDHMNYRNAKLEFDVLAGSKLGAKKEMAQSIPFYMQLLNEPNFLQALRQDGYTLSATEIFKMFTDLSGWRNLDSVLIKLNPQQMAQEQANSPAGLQAAKVQGAAQLQQQKFAHDEQIQDEKQLGRAAGEVTRQAIEKAMTSEAVEGVPGNQGFGNSIA